MAWVRRLIVSFGPASYQAAPKLQAELEDAGSALAKRPGTEFTPPAGEDIPQRVKKRADAKRS